MIGCKTILAFFLTGILVFIPTQMNVTAFDMLSDVHAAVVKLDDFMRNDLGITPKKMALEGRSAGGHLSMWYGYTREHPSALLYGIDSEEVIPISHIVADVGPTDATDPEIHSLWFKRYNGRFKSSLLLSCLLGADVRDVYFSIDDFEDFDVLTVFPTEILELLIAVSPVAYVTAASPPTLLRYAGQDNQVHKFQGFLLFEALKAVGYSGGDIDIYNGTENCEQYLLTKSGSEIEHNLFFYYDDNHYLKMDAFADKTYQGTYAWYFKKYMH